MSRFEWKGIQHEGSKQYICSFCSNKVASEKRYSRTFLERGSNRIDAEIYICPFCSNPTLFMPNQIPGVKPCGSIEDLPDIVAGLYEEARVCHAAGAYVGAALCCRKMLMNISVDKGEPSGKSFTHYVNFLANSNHVPSACKDHLDHIREIGNAATHKVPSISQEDSEDLLNFLEMVLKFMYEYPEKMNRKKAAAAP